MRAVWIWKCRANLFRIPPCFSHPLGPTNTRRLFYRVGRQCTRLYERMSRKAGAKINLRDFLNIGPIDSIGPIPNYCADESASIVRGTTYTPAECEPTNNTF